MTLRSRTLLPLAGVFLAVVLVGFLIAPQGGGPIGSSVAPAAEVPAPAADSFGYGAAFERELRAIGQISPRDFATRFSPPEYLTQVSFDPTTAKFWEDFASDPEKLRRKLRDAEVSGDFRLNPDELTVFRRNGFVVSGRLAGTSFAEVFYRIYSRDLPVYISSDALLHAWHRSYDAILEELEDTYLYLELEDILTGMAKVVPSAHTALGTGPLADSLKDADYFLAVARSLLADTQKKSELEQDYRVTTTLLAARTEGLGKFSLFGRLRQVDFSQFKPRGHYTNSDRLKRYFRAMMWCGRIDLRIAGGEDATGRLSSDRELGAAVVLRDLLIRSGKAENWTRFDALLQTFVGRTDSATFADIGEVMAKAKIADAAAVKDAKSLDTLRLAVLASTSGEQQVRGDVFTTAPGVRVTLPRSFTFIGQRFAVDSWALSQTVFGSIRWNGEEVERRVPSGLDVAFAAFKNDHVVPELATRMTAGTHPLRDQQNYQHNLAAVRTVIDSQPDAAWKESIYTNWLATLRTLSTPMTGTEFPEAMRTQYWAMKQTNTQLASWTQLRHDTVLYVKPSYGSTILCYYPAGFVEPVLPFWDQLATTADRAAELLAKTPDPRAGSLQALREKQVKFFRAFASQVRVLREIAAKQLARKELTDAEKRVLEDVVQLSRGSGNPTYQGWYPALFYKGSKQSGKWDALVADVHTNPPDDTGPGCVLHQAVGNVDLLMIAIDNGPDRVVYAGPVMSYYEFEVGGTGRKSDQEWKADIEEAKIPPRPEWTHGYLVPGKPVPVPEWRRETKKKFSRDDD
jgi:hypothetical protein